MVHTNPIILCSGIRVKSSDLIMLKVPGFEDQIKKCFIDGIEKVKKGG